MKLQLHHINLCTKNVGDMADFYTSLLGMTPVEGGDERRITTQGYDGKVRFLTEGTAEYHIAEQDLGVAFRKNQSINPLDHGHIAFRTDDLDAFKTRLRERNVPFADYGAWAVGGWRQIFFQDPDGNIVEVHQAD